MKRYLLAALLLSTPALAQPLQFESKQAPALPPTTAPNSPQGPSTSSGLSWLQRQPMTLFDLGMMELSKTAMEAARSNADLRGGLADFSSETGVIAVSFYSAKPYVEQLCADTALDIRDVMFPRRDNPEALASELASYFVSYGPTPPGRPATIGAELMERIHIAVIMPGGICQLPLIGDMPYFWVDPAAKAAAPQEAPKAAAPKDAPKPAPPRTPTRPEAK